MKRPTISDIAQRAGVTKAAVSFALNGRPGVSPATRERILAIAAELGFQPSSAARALTAGHAGAFGLVLGRNARESGREPAWLDLVAGLESELARHQDTLLFTLAEDEAAEIERYRQWWAQRRVDGIFLVDPQVDDQRLGGPGRAAAARGGHRRAARSAVPRWRRARCRVGPLPGRASRRRWPGRPGRRPAAGGLPRRAGPPPGRPGDRPGRLVALGAAARRVRGGGSRGRPAVLSATAARPGPFRRRRRRATAAADRAALTALP